MHAILRHGRLIRRASILAPGRVYVGPACHWFSSDPPDNWEGPTPTDQDSGSDRRGEKDEEENSPSDNWDPLMTPLPVLDPSSSPDQSLSRRKRRDERRGGGAPTTGPNYGAESSESSPVGPSNWNSGDLPDNWDPLTNLIKLGISPVGSWSLADHPDKWDQLAAPPPQGNGGRLRGRGRGKGKEGGSGGGFFIPPGDGFGSGSGFESGEGEGNVPRKKWWGGSDLGMDLLTPREICQSLDKFVIGQQKAKKACIHIFSFNKPSTVNLQLFLD